MLSHSKLGSATGAAEFFRADDYYSEKGSAPAHWIGKGAAQLGLSGDVKLVDFERALKGYGPGGITLSSRAGNSERTPGWDFAFSPPKSVSILALAIGDARLVEAHNAAVKDAISFIESEFAVARVTHDGETVRERSGNLLVAAFRHGLSRERDPQVHTHAVIVNATQTNDGRYRALDSASLYDAHSAASVAYMNKLAMEVKAAGYDINFHNKDGSRKPYGGFEIHGVSNDTIEALSKRRETILDHVAKADHITPKSKSSAALITRPAKQSCDISDVRQSWKTQLGPNYQALKRLAEGAEKRTSEPDLFLSTARDRNSETLAFAEAHLTSQNSVFKLKDLYTTAIEHSIGEVDLAKLVSSVNERQKNDDLLTGFAGPSRYATTTRMVEMEKDTFKLARQLAGASKRFVDLSHFVSDLFRKYKNVVEFTDQQNETIDTIVKGKDRITIVQGYAGVGKTTLLAEANQRLERHRLDVRGLAPTNIAVDGLEEAGIRSSTLERYLNAPNEDLSNTVLFLDESSMVGTEKMNKLMERLVTNKPAKLVLVGDSEQLPAIDAGKPFKQLQAAFHTKFLTEIRRQKSKTNREAVLLAGTRQANNALTILDKSIIETDRSKLVEQGVEAWKATRQRSGEQPLLVTATHDVRRALNQSVHNHLIKRGELSGDRHEVEIERTRYLTSAQQRYARYYSPGDIINFLGGLKSQGFEKNSIWSITGVDEATNALQLLSTQGDEKWLELGRRGRMPNLQVLRAEKIELSCGEEVAISRSQPEMDIRAGDRAVIVSIDNDEIVLALKKKSGDQNQVTISRDTLAPIDYSYAVTTHSSQGVTADSVISVIDTRKKQALSREQFYVQISRARNDLTIITDDKAQLRQILEQGRIDASALELYDAIRERTELPVTEDNPPRPMKQDRTQNVENTPERDISRDRSLSFER